MIWNAQGKKHLAEFEEALAEDLRTWDVLLLQEVSNVFEAADTVIVNETSTTGGKSAAVVLHRRHARRFTEWLQGPCPALTVTKGRSSRDGQDTYLSFASVYLPHGGHSEQLWDKSLEAVQQTIRHCQRLGQVVISGDFNTAELRTLLGDDEPSTMRSSGRAGVETYLRAQQTFQLMNDSALYSLVPSGGHQPTHVPRQGSQPRTLDYQLVSKSLLA